MIDTLIVDGYNVIYAIPELENKLAKSLLEARRALTEALQRYQAAERSIKRIYVAYDSKDGSGGVEDMGLVKNLYAPGGSNADQEIVRMLKSQDGGKRTAVLSRDNFVINHARSMGASVLPLEKFINKLYRIKKVSSAFDISDAEKEEINRELKKIWRIK